jgi:hypothetical protein
MGRLGQTYARHRTAMTFAAVTARLSRYSEAVKSGPVLTSLTPHRQLSVRSSLIFRPLRLVEQARTRVKIIRSERPHLVLLLSVLLLYFLELQNA